MHSPLMTFLCSWNKIVKYVNKPKNPCRNVTKIRCLEPIMQTDFGYLYVSKECIKEITKEN
jgi:hypothetical protein